MNKRRRLTTNTTSHQPSTNPYIPQGILFQEILTRLPVEPLIRFKSVCKSWRSFISGQQFSKLHLKQSDHIRFMFAHDSRCTLLYEAAPDGTSEYKQILRTKEDDDGETNGCVDLLASCDGLFCVSNAEDEFFLWNPSTRESRKIPGSRIEFPRYSRMRASVFFGLGHHSASDDYRLVRISMFDGVDFQTEVKVYSRNMNTWKRIGDFPFDFPLGRPGKFVNGNLHWIVSISRGNASVYMVAFLDLGKENYGLIELPEFEQKVSSFDIGSFGENLGLLCCYSKFAYDVWILKTESWTRIKIAVPCIEAFVYFDQPLYVVSKPKGYEIVIKVDAEKCGDDSVCSVIHHQHKVRETRTVCFMESPRIVSFLQSLVSPNAH